jgi:cell division protease FtsH
LTVGAAIVLVLIAISILILILNDLGAPYLTILFGTIPILLLKSFISAYVFVFMCIAFFTKYGNKNKIGNTDTKVSFDDIIGLRTVKKELIEIVNLIKNRKQIQGICGNIIKGILINGINGCGKTLLVKAIETECKIPFISISGSEFIEIFVGAGVSKVKNIFNKAREYVYAYGACIVFIDNIEIIGNEDTDREEINNIKNQLLIEMDELGNKNKNIIVIATTSVEINKLDEALLRAGRFDKRILVNLPNLKERSQLFDFYFKKMKVTTKVKLDELAKETSYSTPAEIENIVREAVLISMRKHGKNTAISAKDLSEAMDRIDSEMDPCDDYLPYTELKSTSYHEAGHAVVLYLLHPVCNDFKVKVKNSGNSLGYVYEKYIEEPHHEDKKEMIIDIMVSLGGYVAEKIKFNTVTAGVYSDLKIVMDDAISMVWELGMSENGFLGNYIIMNKKGFLSESLKEKLNNESIRIINSCYSKIEQFLRINWDAVDVIAKKLITNKELDFNEIKESMEIIGKRKHNISFSILDGD